MEEVEMEHNKVKCGDSEEHSDKIGYGQISALKLSSMKEDAVKPNEVPVKVTLKTKLAGIRAGCTLSKEGGS
jgi:hypothetical protein